MTSIAEAVAQMPIDRLHADSVKRFIEDLPGAAEGLPRTSLRSESP
jgi:hypothetical protein